MSVSATTHLLSTSATFLSFERYAIPIQPINYFSKLKVSNLYFSTLFFDDLFSPEIIQRSIANAKSHQFFSSSVLESSFDCSDQFFILKSLLIASFNFKTIDGITDQQVISYLLLGLFGPDVLSFTPIPKAINQNITKSLPHKIALCVGVDYNFQADQIRFMEILSNKNHASVFSNILTPPLCFNSNQDELFTDCLLLKYYLLNQPELFSMEDKRKLSNVIDNSDLNSLKPAFRRLFHQIYVLLK